MSTPQNPYEAPKSPIGQGRAIGVRSGLRSDLRAVAVAQKGILLCILAQILIVVFNLTTTFGQIKLPPAVAYLILGVSLILSVAQLVFVFSLAIKVYNVGLGIFFGILALIPCVGLIILLIINGKATNVLTQNGHKVGLLGANLAEFPKPA
jgi:hypothetical protein